MTRQEWKTVSAWIVGGALAILVTDGSGHSLNNQIGYLVITGGGTFAVTFLATISIARRFITPRPTLIGLAGLPGGPTSSQRDAART